MSSETAPQVWRDALIRGPLGIEVCIAWAFSGCCTVGVQGPAVQYILDLKLGLQCIRKKEIRIQVHYSPWHHRAELWVHRERLLLCGPSLLEVCSAGRNVTGNMGQWWRATGLFWCFLGHGTPSGRSKVMFQEAECMTCHAES